jgi:mannose-1-phosphate guanylyltransferase / mannose-6-phosphate isomerase
LARVSDREIFAEPVVITNEEYRHIVADQLEALGIEASILLEPVCKDSGPAIVAGTSFIANSDPGAIVIVLAADHVVQDLPAFQSAVREAAKAAEAGAIVTFGITPDQPATGYGYIRCGAKLDGSVRKVAAFVEKPDKTTARRYIEEGYLWNSGNFLFRADALLSEYERFDAPTVTAVRSAVEKSKQDLGWRILDFEAFRTASAHSIDVAVMEKTEKAAVIPVSMGWSDVGSWHAVWELTDKDERGNAVIGDAVFLDASNNFVSSKHLVCLTGVDDLAVISTADATVVFRHSDLEAMRPLVKKLEAQGRKQVSEHLEVFRPWGSYQSLDLGSRFQVKRIMVKPGGRLSLQKHFHRAEHWIVVRGTALVTVGEQQKILRENESTYIPLGEVHRLENPGKIPLELIEVQSGSYLG